MLLSALLGLTAPLGPTACVEPPPPTPATADALLFDRPQDLLYIDDLLVVANTKWRPGDFGPGEILLLDAQTGALRHRLPTTQPNPQRLRVHRGVLYVLNTGVMDLSDFDRPSTRGPGSLDAWPLDGLTQATEPAWSLLIEPVDLGPVWAAAPIDLALNGDHALISMGLANAVRSVDLREPRLGDVRTYGAPTLGLGSLAPWREGFALVDFNGSTLHLFDAEGRPWPCHAFVGEYTDRLEGAKTLRIAGDEAWFVLDMSAKLRAVDLRSAHADAPQCGLSARTQLAQIAESANDLQIRGELAWVVDSSRNRVEAVHLHSGRSAQNFVLGPQRNPFHLALHPNGRQAAVTEWLSNTLSLLDLESGEIRRLGEQPADDTAPPPADLDASAPSVPTDLDASAPSPTEDGGAGAYPYAELLADEVRLAQNADPSRPYGDPALAVNGVRGRTGGSHDVYSLIGDDDALILGWSGRRFHDGPGPDLVIFENPFPYPGGIFMDLTVVEVSSDGERWVAFEHGSLGEDPSVYVPDPALWPGFAGRAPVHLHVEDHPVHPFDALAGGDLFDLADLPQAHAETAAIAERGAAFVRLTPAGAHVDPRTQAPYVRDPVSNGPDIDGAAARYLTPGP